MSAAIGCGFNLAKVSLLKRVLVKGIFLPLPTICIVTYTVSNFDGGFGSGNGHPLINWWQATNSRPYGTITGGLHRLTPKTRFILVCFRFHLAGMAPKHPNSCSKSISTCLLTQTLRPLNMVSCQWLQEKAPKHYSWGPTLDQSFFSLMCIPKRGIDWKYNCMPAGVMKARFSCFTKDFVNVIILRVLNSSFIPPAKKFRRH